MPLVQAWWRRRPSSWRLVVCRASRGRPSSKRSPVHLVLLLLDRVWAGWRFLLVLPGWCSLYRQVVCRSVGHWPGFLLAALCLVARGVSTWAEEVLRCIPLLQC